MLTYDAGDECKAAIHLVYALVRLDSALIFPPRASVRPPRPLQGASPHPSVCPPAAELQACTAAAGEKIALLEEEAEASQTARDLEASDLRAQVAAKQAEMEAQAQEAQVRGCLLGRLMGGRWLGGSWNPGAMCESDIRNDKWE